MSLFDDSIRTTPIEGIDRRTLTLRRFTTDGSLGNCSKSRWIILNSRYLHAESQPVKFQNYDPFWTQVFIFLGIHRVSYRRISE
jgi:FMN-dependent NADH-azoreductase